MTAPLHLLVHWRPEDQAWLLANQNRRGTPLRIHGWGLLTTGLILALAAPVAARLAVWATANPWDPAPLLVPPGWDELLAPAAILGVTLLIALLLPLWDRPGLRLMLEGRAEEGREPLLGPVEVTLAPDHATFRAASWESRTDAAMLTGFEEMAGLLVLSFGPGRRTVLPRRDLSATEALAVREWATAVLARGGLGRTGGPRPA